MTESKLKIEFEATGEVWDKVTDYSITEDFFTAADGWTATVFSGDAIALRRKFQPRTLVRLYLGERLQLIGQIDKTEGAGGGSTALKLTGRDYLATLIDPSVDKDVRIVNTMSLADALLEGLRVFGITEIEGDVDKARATKMGKPTFETRNVPTVGPDRVVGPTSDDPLASDLTKGPYSGPLYASLTGIYTGQREVTYPTTEKVSDAKPNENEGAYEWASRLAARSGFTIQPGSKRSAIAVVAPDYSKQPQYALARPGNIEDGVATRDWSSIPTIATLSSRTVTAELEAKGKFKFLTIVGDDSELSIWRVPEAKRILQAAKAVGVRRKKTETGDPSEWYCPVYYRDDEAKSEKQLNRSARRIMADRLRETLSYDCTLKGHTDARGTTYAINNLATVRDSVEDVDEVLWIAQRTLSGGNGDVTKLQLIRPASYVL